MDFSIGAALRTMVMLMADSEDHMQKKLPSADAYRAKTRRIPCISSTHMLASNSDYSTHATEFIEIPADYFPNADYCLRLTTNMLHPIYIKDDIIAVEQNFPHFGDIALFLNENIQKRMAHHTLKLSADVIDPCISQVISFVWERFSESSVWRTQENRLLHKGGFSYI